MDNSDIDIKKIFSIVCYFVLIFAGIQVFVTINSLVSMDTYQIKGYSLVMIAFLFFIYSIFTNKKPVYYISIVFIIGGYTYTFYTLYRINDNALSFKSGFFLYVLSFILFIITLLLKIKTKNKKEDNNLIKSISQTSKNSSVEEKYIIGTYLYGIKGKPEFSNRSCAVTTNGDSKNLIIILTSNSTFNYEIKYEQIQKITVKKGLSISHGSTQLAEDHTTEKMMLGYALAGIWGSMLVENLNSSSDKIKYSVGFTVEILYKIGEESKKIVIEFPQNPDYFFRSYAELYEKIS